MCHALIFAVTDAIQKQASDSELEQWKTVILTCSFIFHCEDNEEKIYWKTIEFREDVNHEYHTVALSPFQKICEIVSTKERLEKSRGSTLSDADLAKEYNTKAAPAEDGEQIQDTQITGAVSVWKQALSIDIVLRKVVELENDYGKNGPFDTMYKMATLVRKAKSEEVISWVFCSIYDAFKSGVLEKGGLQTRMIEPPGGKGIVELYWFKKQLCDYLATNFAREMKIDPKVATSIGVLTSSHDLYREKCGWPGKEKDLSWMDFKESGGLYHKLAEDICFNVTHDASLKSALKARKIASEVVQYGSIGEVINEIKSLSAEEKQDDETEKPVVAEVDEDDQEDQAQAKIAKQIAPGTEQEFQKFVDYADRLVRQYVSLVVEPASEEALTDMIKDKPVGKAHANFGTSFLINFDVKASGESMTHPHLRTVSVNEAYIKQMVGSVIAARGGIAENDVYLLYDAGKHGNERLLMSAFKAEGNKSIPHDPKRLYVCTGEESLASRRSKTRGFATLDQMEFVYAVTKEGLKVPERKRKLYEGSNHGNMYGPLGSRIGTTCGI